jgi:hypothetical protein
MYRIELAPGEEALFKSIDEMAAGIANGVIQPTARIWHQTSAKWLPIEFHPHYKIALNKGPQAAPRADYREAPGVAGPAALHERPIFEAAAPRPLFDVPAVPAAPVPLFERPVPAADHGDSPAGVALTLAEPAVQVDELGADFIEINPSRGRGRTWTVGAAAAAAVVLLGGGATFSAFRSSRKPAAPAPRTITTPTTPASYGAQPVVIPPTTTPSFGSRTSRPADDSVTAARTAPEKIADAPHIVEAPKVSMSALSLSDSDRPASDRPSAGVSPAGLVARYGAAYEDARSELDRGIRLAGLGSIFASSRLVPGQVASARSTIAGVANLVRVYRKRSATIEQAYRDSVTLLSRQLGWTPAQIAVWESRPTQLEAPEVGAMANALLDAMDGVLAVLTAQEGGYQLSGSSISFGDPAAARDYNTARRRLTGLIGSGADSGTPAGRILKALGRSLPPEDRGA